MKTVTLMPLLVSAAILGCAHPTVEKKVYVLDGDETKTDRGLIIVHEIPFWGKAADHNTVVVANPESKSLIEAVLNTSPPATETTVATFDEFVSQYIQREKDPQVVAVQNELKDHPAVIISHKRAHGGFWSRLFGG